MAECGGLSLLLFLVQQSEGSQSEEEGWRREGAELNCIKLGSGFGTRGKVVGTSFLQLQLESSGLAGL